MGALGLFWPTYEMIWLRIRNQEGLLFPINREKFQKLNKVRFLALCQKCVDIVKHVLSSLHHFQISKFYLVLTNQTQAYFIIVIHSTHKMSEQLEILSSDSFRQFCLMLQIATCSPFDFNFYKKYKQTNTER